MKKERKNPVRFMFTRRQKTHLLIGVAVAAIVCGFFLWLGLWKENVPFNFRSVVGFLVYGGFAITIPIIIVLIAFAWDRVYWLVPVITLGAAALFALLFTVIGLVSSGHVFHAKRFASQITIPEPVPFSDGSIEPFDATKIPWIDEEYASALGDKQLGTLGAIGSSVEVGEYVRQEVNGELYFVAPLLHTNYWRYKANRAGTPGYIMVSMIDDNDVRLVSDFQIRVQPAGHAAWNDKLERIVQRVMPFGLRYECKFEIDDNLHPWWVVPIYENQIGVFAGPEIVSVVLVDATDGSNAQIYSVDEVPTWVDRIYPSRLIEEQIANWGKYSGGWLNSWWSMKGLLQSDEGNAVVYSGDDCFLFDSLTSYKGKDESTVGFVLTNMRTKEVQYYSLPGATEYAACQSALGDERVKAQNYAAVFPLPTKIEGVPTYFIPLRDPLSGIIKSFALVNIEKHQIVGIGTTIREAELDYRAAQWSSGSASLFSTSADPIKVTGKILRWGSYTQKGNTYYKFVVEGQEDKLLTMDASASEAAITREGDRVQLELIATLNASWSVRSFDNLEFNQTPAS